jgi:hypothetical protein
MKKCKVCQQKKELIDFYTNKSGKCKKCQLIHSKTLPSQNKEFKKQKYQERISNPDLKNKDIEQRKLKYSQNKHKIDKIKKTKRNRDWYLKNREKRLKQTSEYEQKRKKIDTLFNLKKRVRVSIKNNIKKHKTADIIGCSYEELLCHMGPCPSTNHHIDHICPCSQAENEVELLKLQNYLNLRWLPANENLSKSDTKTPEAEERCRILLGREWHD